MATNRKTFLNLIDEISIYINGKAATSNSRPTKSEIGVALNDAQILICNGKQQYSFLRDTEVIEAFTLGNPDNQFNAHLVTMPGGNSQSAVTVPNSAPVTSYIITKLNLINIDNVTRINTAWLQLFKGAGFGNVSADLTPMICNGDTIPNVNSPIYTGTPINIINNVISTGGTLSASTPIQVPFSFTDAAIANVNNGYWLVIKVSTRVGNTSDIGILEWNAVTSNDSGVISSSGVTTMSTHTFYAQINYATGDFIETLTIPENARYINRIYSEDEVTVLQPYPYNRKQWNNRLTPMNIFSITGQDTSGNKLILVRANQQELFWYVEYEKIPDLMVNDGDYPIIPKEYVDVLKYKTILVLLANQNTVGMSTEVLVADFNAALKKLNEDYLPYDDSNMSVNVGGYTDIYSDESVSTTPNTWQTDRSNGGDATVRISVR